MANAPEASTSPRRPTKLPSPTSSPYRPRLSPRDENGASGAGGASDFFAVPPTPARDDSGGAQFGFGGPMSAAEGAAKWASLQSGLPTGSGGHSGFNFGVTSGGQSPPATSSSPAAFSKFARPTLEAIRGPSTIMGSPTPLAQPSGPSPFFPSSTTSSASSFPAANPGPSSSPASTSSFTLPTQSSFSFSQSPAISLPTSSRPPQQSPAARLNSNATSRYTQLAPSQLVELLTASASPAVLILDLRTHSAHVHGRLRRSVSINVPSTLLRRPGYGIDRVGEGLSPSEQSIFNTWNSASTVVALDLDSNSVAEGSPIASLLAKFEKAGFAGQLAWIKGGWNAVRAEVKATGAAASALLDSGEKAPASDDSSALSTSPGKGGASLSHSNSISKKHARPVLQVRDLPISAFQQASTSAFSHAGLPSSSMSIGGRPTGESGRGDSRPGLGKRRKSGNEGFGLALDMHSPHDNGQLPPTPGMESTGEKRMATNPFFDNIRQNSEALSLERSLAHLSPVDLAAIPATLAAFLPPYLSRLLQLSPMKRAELLARQFYELEVAERERLEGTLNWHATVQDKENESNVEAQRFKKFGISAGVELGSLNRFKNIFPYDHSRVRLRKYASGATDYINASHIQLEGSHKRYIASQGPLPTTYHDFWQLCDQEQVGVIVMVTNVHEGGREKCGRYWMCGSEGEWLVEATGGGEDDVERTEKVPERQEGGFFAPTQAPEPEETPADQSSTVRRTIQVQRKDEVGKRPPRKIRHIQYRAWPDFDVPAAPEDVVALVREVEAAQADYLREIDWKGEVEPPIVTHCSAGCGRTGVFILVSTILERMRQDRAAARKAASTQSIKSTVDVVDSMEIDSPLSTTTAGTADQPSTNPFEFPESVGTSQTNTQTLASMPAYPPFPRMASTTPSSLIPQTASLSLAPDSRPMLVHHSSQSPPIAPPFAPISTPLPLDPASSSESAVPALASADPIFAGVNDLRTQRMSMVANYRQYVSIHECVLVGAAQAVEDELEMMRRTVVQA